jgi:hypothetical protein
MIKETETPSKYTKEETIDFIALFKKLWEGRRNIFGIIVVFFFIGLFVAIFSNNEFTSSTTFVPHTESDAVKSDLGGLASLAGINLGGDARGLGISPELYPQIVGSIPFKKQLLSVLLNVKDSHEPVTYREYYTKIYKPGLLANLKKYTIGLPRVVISILKPLSSETFKQSGEKIISSLTEQDYMLIKQLEKQMSLTINDSEGFITISATLPEALASAQFTLKAQELLQDYIMIFKTKKSKEELKFIEERYQEKKEDFMAIEIKLARFKDQNINLNTAVSKTKLLQLQSEHNLAFSLYTELSKQLENQRLQIKKDTPLFTILKPVNIPNEKSWPKRTLILSIYVFLGLVIGVFFVFGRHILIELKQEWKDY